MNVFRQLGFVVTLMALLLVHHAAWAQEGGGGFAVEEPGQGPEVVAPVSIDAFTSAAFSGGPLYDSGWIALRPGAARTLKHALGGNQDDYVVILDYKTDDVNGINQRYFGGADFGTHPAPGHAANDRVGAYWRSLTSSTITIYRRPEDTYADWVRVRIWVDPYPNYDSGWVTLAPGAAATTLNHNLGGDPNDYVVDMEYKSAGSGINQRYFGGADFGSKSFGGTRNNYRVGAYWRSLTSNTITLFRRAEDEYAGQVRVRIWYRPWPTYDSGWVSINPNQAMTLYHYIGGDPNNYVVSMIYKSASSGINLRYYGGMDAGAQPPPGVGENDRVGAYWRSLNKTSITVYRRPEDPYAQQVRIRIWHYWQPVAPDYDSDWVSLNAGGPAYTLQHHVGGNATRYLVQLTYKAQGVTGVNQRYYGGADFGTHPAPGHVPDDRVGLYWRSLNSSTITLFRRAEDTYAPKARVRIWNMPKPDYDSGWTAINPNQAKTFYHNLQGSVYDYLVDLQYRDGSIVNQRYYGGMDVGAHGLPGVGENARVGAYWRSLTNTSITVYRRPEDDYAQQVRVRIWRMAPANYDSGWVSLNPNQAKVLYHRLNSHPDHLLLQMWQYDTAGNGINQRHFGGADFGTHPPSGYQANDRVGSYWRSLTTDKVTIYRRPEDGFADRVRVRIWDYSQRQYLPMMRK